VTDPAEVWRLPGAIVTEIRPRAPQAPLAPRGGPITRARWGPCDGPPTEVRHRTVPVTPLPRESDFAASL